MQTAIPSSVIEDYKELLSTSLARFAITYGGIPPSIVVSKDVWGFMVAARARMPCRVIVDRSMPAQSVRLHAPRQLQSA